MSIVTWLRDRIFGTPQDNAHARYVPLSSNEWPTPGAKPPGRVQPVAQAPRRPLEPRDIQMDEHHEIRADADRMERVAPGIFRLKPQRSFSDDYPTMMLHVNPDTVELARVIAEHHEAQTLKIQDDSGNWVPLVEHRGD